jgi:hypothetical protein
MSLTLALGLKYEPPQRTEFLPSRQEGTSFNLEQGLTPNDTSVKSNPVIDVKPIEINTPPTTQVSSQHYDYLTYNIRATLDILQAIGTRLHISI